MNQIENKNSDNEIKKKIKTMRMSETKIERKK